VEKRVKITRRFAIATAIGMLIVLLMGARVTSTGSGEGCGTDWPLCHGNWLPQNTYESITEYSHRLVTGIEGILVAVTAVLAWPMRNRYPETKILVPAMAGTLIFQSLMGAAAVKWPTSPEVMASHFGISLICLASAALLARVLNEKREDLDLAHTRPANRPLSPASLLGWYKWIAAAGVVVSILVAYSGAYVRHRGAELACTSWPTCHGDLIPSFEGLAGIHTIHRLGALLISLLIVAFVVAGFRIRRYRPDLFQSSVWALVLVIAQSLIGLIVVESGLQLMATLGHAAGMSLLFVVLCDAVRISWGSRATGTSEHAPDSAHGMAPAR
jgi:cytochrome c oxidase assembly protein subunit 15